MSACCQTRGRACSDRGACCASGKLDAARKAGRPLGRSMGGRSYDDGIARGAGGMFDGVQPGRRLWAGQSAAHDDPALFHHRGPRPIRARSAGRRRPGGAANGQTVGLPGRCGPVRDHTTWCRSVSRSTKKRREDRQERRHRRQVAAASPGRRTDDTSSSGTGKRRSHGIAPVGFARAPASKGGQGNPRRAVNAESWRCVRSDSVLCNILPIILP